MYKFLFSQRGLSLDRLRVLIIVQDSGGIARSAPGDVVKQSQYSRQLRELSEFFGCEVTQRIGKELKLTPEGLRIAELARQFLRDLEDFSAECRATHTMFSIAAGDSLIQWLIIPRLSGLLKALPNVRFNTLSLRTNEIIQQVVNAQIDFGLVRKNAVTIGLKSSILGTLSYVAVVPTSLARRPIPSFSEIFEKFPFAMQTTDGQFSKQLMKIARSRFSGFRPGLGCQSFPQTLAAVRSGQFASVVPKLAVQELPSGFVHSVSSESLKQLERDIVLVWNPRVTKVRANATKVATQIQSALRFE